MELVKWKVYGPAGFTKAPYFFLDGQRQNPGLFMAGLGRS